MPELNGDIEARSAKRAREAEYTQKMRAIEARQSIDQTGHCEPWDGLFANYEKLTAKPEIVTKEEVEKLARVKKDLLETFGEGAFSLYRVWKKKKETKEQTLPPKA